MGEDECYPSVVEDECCPSAVEDDCFHNVVKDECLHNAVEGGCRHHSRMTSLATTLEEMTLDSIPPPAVNPMNPILPVACSTPRKKSFQDYSQEMSSGSSSDGNWILGINTRS